MNRSGEGEKDGWGSLRPSLSSSKGAILIQTRRCPTYEYAGKPEVLSVLGVTIGRVLPETEASPWYRWV